MILSLVTGFTAFMVMMLSETGKGLSISTLFVLLLGLVLTLMITGIYFPQMVLFSLSPVIRLSNCLVFGLTHPVKVIGTSLLQLIWFLLFALFMPWSMILMPFMGLWFILLVSHFILYDDMNESFAIEERIAQVYPDQVAVYEDDAAWLRRKQEEAMQTR